MAFGLQLYDQHRYINVAFVVITLTCINKSRQGAVIFFAQPPKQK
jgi:hypothetical protein